MSRAVLLLVASVCIGCGKPLVGGMEADVPPPPWTFGVMADSQWIFANDPNNPNSVAAEVIKRINDEFIARQVKFVIQVGDLSDDGAVQDYATRAIYAQALYDAGIGFYPLRGNHDSGKASEFRRVFPQTQDGLIAGVDFSSPSPALRGLSYSFEYENARFVLLDSYPTEAMHSNSIVAQQPWLEETLASRPAGGHAFVFAHTGLIGASHVETLFGADPNQAPSDQDAFITTLADNGVRYFIRGHDHLHNRALVSTTDGSSAHVEEIICAGASNKFYASRIPSVDEVYSVPEFGHQRQTPISYEANAVGYYIFTVDGPRVTVDFFAGMVESAFNGWFVGTPTFSVTPPIEFTKDETFGYALNGKQFIVPWDETYTMVHDRFGSTSARILSGVNLSRATDGSDRPQVMTVNTGWTPRDRATASDVLTLWGMIVGLGGHYSYRYALAMTYPADALGSASLADGGFGLAAKDDSGNWVNAVDLNSGGTKTFVSGPWDPSYATNLGTYGIDAKTHTAWAVLNHIGEFAVATFAQAAPKETSSSTP